LPTIEIQKIDATCCINLDVVRTKIRMKNSHCMKTRNALSNRVPLLLAGSVLLQPAGERHNSQQALGNKVR
jgi:hypothetical protein